MSDLTALLTQAASRQMTPQELFEQKVSWCFGQLSADDERTKEDVRRCVAALSFMGGAPDRPTE